MITLADKEKMFEQEQQENAKREEKLRNMFERYNGGTNVLGILNPKEEILSAKWNRHNLFPVTKHDPVYVHPDQADVAKGYIRVVYYNGEHVATLNKSYFQ